jgi:alpha-beta hydrolase superfamily lysophospholipase
MNPLSDSSRRPVEFPAVAVWLIAINMLAFVAQMALAAVAGAADASPAQRRQTVAIRGHEQSLYVYGSPQGEPVIVSSGDGGWIHLGPHVAEFLAEHGFFVIGFDVKSYLSSFTSGRTTLSPEQEPADYRVLADVAKKATGKKPMLIGVSEGAGLSVLAATDTATKGDITGVIGLGLPDISELAWRWKDSLIYLTHRTPNEPAFSAAAIVDRIAPLPLAAIHSTHDDFVPVADVERVLKAANEPKRLWIVNASNHRFSDNLDEFDRQLLDAIAWVNAHAPR